MPLMNADQFPSKRTPYGCGTYTGIRLPLNAKDQFKISS
jgi:hypothetical protein